MLRLNYNVNKGIMFIRLEGVFDNKSFNMFSNNINYLLYNQGIHYYVFNFKDVNKYDRNVLIKLNSKLKEILLKCGKVVMCGVSDLLKKEVYSDNVLFINKELDVFNYISL